MTDTVPVEPSEQEFLGPFGNPDGSRADLSDILRDFTDFHGNPAYVALAMRPNDLSARIMVGKMGSGKTVYLRRFQAAASSDAATYAGEVQQDPFSTELVVRVCHWFRDADLNEKWMLLWRRAILRSVVSHLLCSRQLRDYVALQDAEAIAGFDGLAREFRAPLTIYAQLAEIIRSHERPHQLSTYLSDPRWDELEYLVGNVLKNCPPMCFYVDAVDEEFATAPLYWMRCQQGLFYQVMRYLRDPRLGSRLHIIVAIRDIVLSSVLRGEQQNRYRGEPHIRILDWDIRAIRYFLHEKLAHLSARWYCSGGPDEPTVRNWLGRASVRNLARQVDEPIEDYILRHTRLLPRDVIMIGNLLCAEVLQSKDRGEKCLSEDAVRRIVRTAGRWFGEQQIAVCANQIAADTMPQDAAAQDYAEVYTSTRSYHRGVEEQLQRFLRAFERDRVPRVGILEAVKASHRWLREDSDVLTVLWQNGLIGYVDPTSAHDDTVFYSVKEMDRFHLPLDAETYVLHPCVIDAVAGIRGTGAPVHSYRRNDS